MKLILFVLILFFAGFTYLVVKLTNHEINDIRTRASIVNSSEAESGVIQDPAMVHDDSTASGGKYVSFMANNISTTPQPTTIQTLNQVTLVDSYYLPETFRSSHLGYYGIMKYRPRSFVTGKETGDKIQWNGQLVSITDPKRFSSWDILNMPNQGVFTKYAGDDLTTIRLNRPSEIAIVWISKTYIPNWLKSWTLSDSVILNIGTINVYTKKFAAGDVKIGGLFDSGNVLSGPIDLPIVLIGEQNGQASTTPSVPSGQTVPIANQTCPTWVHDQYVTVGPDGQTYSTWHPQIDKIYWCYFRHEHGSNPEKFKTGYKIAYNYTPTRSGTTEPHNGFKTYVVDNPVNTNQVWLLSHHFGTGSINRACVRFHSIDVAVLDKTTGELLADLHAMGDTGRSVANTTQEVLTPPNCPDQGTTVPPRSSTVGLRQLPVNSLQAIGYEPWAVTFPNILGMKTGFQFNTFDGMVICDTLNCSVPVSNPNHSGTRRHFSDIANLGITAGTNNGTFYTDPLAQKLLTSTDTNAVKQYVKPGINLTLPAGYTCTDINGWDDKMECLPTLEANNRTTSTIREASIQIPN